MLPLKNVYVHIHTNINDCDAMALDSGVLKHTVSRVCVSIFACLVNVANHIVNQFSFACYSSCPNDFTNLAEMQQATDINST